MTEPTATQNKDSFQFSFGSPEPVMGLGFQDLLGTFLNQWQGYYVPPITPLFLSQLRNACTYHGSAITFKRNQLAKYFVPKPELTLKDFVAAALDFETFGNCYFLKIFDYMGNIIALRHIAALNMRRMPDVNGLTQFCQLANQHKIEFQPGEVLQVMSYETGQQIYGMPDWLCGLQSILLNEDATLFRRKYYANGCHIGYILYTSDPSIDDKTKKMLQEKIQEGKGVGNFKSVYINIPNGKEKAVQIIPVGDISQKDEFERIKNISANDVLVAHRLPPALAGMKPENTGGFGDIDKINKLFVENEIKPMAMNFTLMNDQLPKRVQFQFDFPEIQ